MFFFQRSPLLDLMSEDMRRDRERQRWEEEAYEELTEETGPVHYQDVQHNGLWFCEHMSTLLYA